MLKHLACLEACKKLHEIGALTDTLVPDIVVEEGLMKEIGIYCFTCITVFLHVFVGTQIFVPSVVCSFVMQRLNHIVRIKQCTSLTKLSVRVRGIHLIHTTAT